MSVIGNTPLVCVLPGCGVLPGDILHLFSSCSYLEDMLAAAVLHAHARLTPFVQLLDLFNDKFASLL